MTLLLLLLASPPFSSPAVEVDADDTLREPWRAACEAIARELPGPGGAWRVRVRQAATIEEFVARTGRASFEAAAFTGDTIWIQARPILDRFGDLDPIRRHECVHARLRFLSVPPLPRVVEEAIALGLSGQAARLPPVTPFAKEELLDAESILAHPRDRARFEHVLARAHATVWSEWQSRAGEARLSYLRAIAAAGNAWVDRL